jgi:pyrroline-5-carboxylate reductase
MTNRIGIIGTGAIAAAIVDGICASPEESPEILLSPRSAAMASALASRHQTVRVCEDNQAVVDGAALLLLTVRPDDAREALRQLRVPGDRVLVSAVAGLSLEALRDQTNDEVTIVRAIPLPAVRQRQGITAIYPAHASVEALFDRLGGTLVAPNPAALDALSASTATISAYVNYVATVARWVAHHGVELHAAERYVRRMFLGIDAALADEATSLSDLGKSHETPGGINEQLRASWFDKQNRTALGKALDDILERVGPD